jgi:hypothetical protein
VFDPAVHGKDFASSRKFAEEQLGIAVADKVSEADVRAKWRDPSKFPGQLEQMRQMNVFNEQVTYLARKYDRAPEEMFKGITYIPIGGKGGMAHLNAVQRARTGAPAYLQVPSAGMIAEEDYKKTARLWHESKKGKGKLWWHAHDIEQESWAQASVRHELAHSLTNERVVTAFERLLQRNVGGAAAQSRFIKSKVSVYGNKNVYERLAESAAKITAPYYKRGQDPTLTWLEEFIDEWFSGKIGEPASLTAG